MPGFDALGYRFYETVNRHPSASGCRSEYREYSIPISLREHVLCLWTQSIVGTPGVYSHRVLPDACVDIVFINDSPPLLVGPWHESFTADFRYGTQILGAHFHPGSAAALLKVPASELLNLSLPLRDVCGRPSVGALGSVADQPSLGAKKLALESVMRDWLSRSVPANRAMRGALHWLASHPGGKIDRLSREMGISPRQLHRRFSAAVGYGPKLFQSVLRFQRLLRRAGRLPAGSGLAGLAAEAGYADQSHMTREVRRFSGKAPRALLGVAECTLTLSDLLGDYAL